ncbi:MAG: hypothetical protein KKE20_05455, partial [Nanoarchaeota archaeon]|nr:hypothetical protein [Nanoarchaeota archaeon]
TKRIVREGSTAMQTLSEMVSTGDINNPALLTKIPTEGYPGHLGYQSPIATEKESSAHEKHIEMPAFENVGAADGSIDMCVSGILEKLEESGYPRPKVKPAKHPFYQLMHEAVSICGSDALVNCSVDPGEKYVLILMTPSEGSSADISKRTVAPLLKMHIPGQLSIEQYDSTGISIQINYSSKNIAEPSANGKPVSSYLTTMRSDLVGILSTLIKPEKNQTYNPLASYSKSRPVNELEAKHMIDSISDADAEKVLAKVNSIKATYESVTRTLHNMRYVEENQKMRSPIDMLGFEEFGKFGICTPERYTALRGTILKHLKCLYNEIDSTLQKIGLCYVKNARPNLTFNAPGSGSS